MSEIQVPNGNGLQVNAGPVTMSASGNTTIMVVLSCMLFAGSMYVVWTQAQMAAMLTMQHNAIMVAIGNLTTANENLFLSTMLPNERKKDLPGYIQDKARQMVERKAERITEKASQQGPAPEPGPFKVE